MGLSMQEGMKLEWRNGLDAYAKEGVADASRFSARAGRQGDFENI